MFRAWRGADAGRLLRGLSLLALLLQGCGAPLVARSARGTPESTRVADAEADDVQLHPASPAGRLVLAQRYEDGKGVKKSASSPLIAENPLRRALLAFAR